MCCSRRRGRMNFDEAIVVHSAWKRNIRAYLEKPDGTLKGEDIGVDNKCELGKWIHGEGRHYAALPEFGTLSSAHKRFHLAAADLVRRANSGADVGAELAIG